MKIKSPKAKAPKPSKDTPLGKFGESFKAGENLRPSTGGPRKD